MAVQLCGVVCIFCGATKQTHPDRDFAGNGRQWICVSCVDNAQFLINNKDRLEPEQMLASMQAEWAEREGPRQ